MQLNGVGSEHNQSSHQITQCMHSHAQDKISGAAMQIRSNEAYTDQQQLVEAINENAFSLSAWLRKALNGGRHLLGALWGGQSSENMGGREQTGAGGLETVSAPLGDENSELSGAVDKLHGGQIAAAASLAQPPVQTASYFTTLNDSSNRQPSVLRKSKVNFHSIASYLNHRFSGNNAYQTKKESSGEDLRKRSRYRGEEEEIDCILTDDSYLLDSYDSKGGYTRLTTKNR